jgi:hypothetical protein
MELQKKFDDALKEFVKRYEKDKSVVELLF